MNINSVPLATLLPGTASTTSPGGIQPSLSPAQAVVQSMLSSEASMVSILNGGTGGSVQTYDASGLLTQIQQASEAAVTGETHSPATQLTNATGGSLDSTSSTNASPLTAASAGNWASILKANPSLSNVAIANAVDQGVVNTINILA